VEALFVMVREKVLKSPGIPEVEPEVQYVNP
jgi:hypothetical protein